MRAKSRLRGQLDRGEETVIEDLRLVGQHGGGKKILPVHVRGSWTERCLDAFRRHVEAGVALRVEHDHLRREVEPI